MPRIIVAIDQELLDIIEEAAATTGLKSSAWARMVLIEKARAVNFNVLCTTKKPPKPPKEIKYKWCGEPCTKEYYEEHAEDERRGRAATAAAVSGLPPEIRKKL